MMAKSGAVAAYIDRKALDNKDLNRLSEMLNRLSITRLSESEIMAMGHLSWDTYRAVREMAEKISPGARCYPHNLLGEGTLCRVRVNPDLMNETVKSDEACLIKSLDNIAVVHISTRDNRLLPEFITFENHSSQIINDLNTLCVKIIRNKEITATEKETLIIHKVRFDPHKARELGVPAGSSFKHLASGQEVVINGRVITPDMVSSFSEIKIHIPGLEKFA
jgi:D-aminoacyl-tRNA deacylase